jgi:DNA-binding transcriptional regulator YiaG
MRRSCKLIIILGSCKIADGGCTGYFYAILVIALIISDAYRFVNTKNRFVSDLKQFMSDVNRFFILIGNKMTIADDIIDSNYSTEQGERIRKLREHTGLSRPQFSKKYAKYGLTKGALIAWEIGRWRGGVPMEGVQKLVKAFHDEGFAVTPEWLLTGSGISPLLNTPISQGGWSAPSVAITDLQMILKELQFFRELHPRAVDAIVTDDAMMPLFNPGDYVAGERYTGDKINAAIGMPSIIQTQAGHILIRLLEQGELENTYTLSSINPYFKIELKSQEKNIELLSVAPIVWIRKSHLHTVKIS